MRAFPTPYRRDSRHLLCNEFTEQNTRNRQQFTLSPRRQNRLPAGIPITTIHPERFPIERLCQNVPVVMPNQRSGDALRQALESKRSPMDRTGMAVPKHDVGEERELVADAGSKAGGGFGQLERFDGQCRGVEVGTRSARVREGEAGVSAGMPAACEMATACKPLRVLQGRRAPQCPRLALYTADQQTALWNNALAAWFRLSAFHSDNCPSPIPTLNNH